VVIPSIVALYAGIITIYNYHKSPEQALRQRYQEARIFENNMDYNKARQLYSSIYAQDSLFPQVAYSYGKLLFHTGNLEKALEILGTVPAWENHTDLFGMQADIQFSLGKYELARQYLNIAIPQLQKYHRDKYWIAKAELVYAENIGVPDDELVTDVLQFCSTVDYELSLPVLPENVLVGDTIEININRVVEKDSMRGSAFMLLGKVGCQLSSRIPPYDSNDTARLLLKAGAYLQGPQCSSMNILEESYLNYLQCLGRSLSALGNSEPGILDKQRNNAQELLMEIAEENRISYPKITELAKLLLSAQGWNEQQVSIEQSKYSVVYHIEFTGGCSPYNTAKIYWPSNIMSEKVYTVENDKKFSMNEKTILERRSLSTQPLYAILSYQCVHNRKHEIRVYPSIHIINENTGE